MSTLEFLCQKNSTISFNCYIPNFAEGGLIIGTKKIVKVLANILLLQYFRDNCHSILYFYDSSSGHCWLFNVQSFRNNFQIIFSLSFLLAVFCMLLDYINCLIKSPKEWLWECYKVWVKSAFLINKSYKLPNWFVGRVQSIDKWKML